MWSRPTELSVNERLVREPQQAGLRFSEGSANHPQAILEEAGFHVCALVNSCDADKSREAGMAGVYGSVLPAKSRIRISSMTTPAPPMG
jgi:hypothetical protein